MSTDFINALKAKSAKRKNLLMQQLKLSSPEQLNATLNSSTDLKEIEEERKSRRSSEVIKTSLKTELTTKINNEDDIPDEDKEKVYTDSTAFLKGTQSANPHNDYSQYFVDTSERPQNFIRDVGLANRFEEYPKLRELIRLKDDLIERTNISPQYLKCDLDTFDLTDLDTKFDVILIEPPLEEMSRMCGAVCDKYWNWDEIERLEIEQIASQRSFCWIWCGSSDGLDAARRCFKKWGFRRCEDICWIKTNKKKKDTNAQLENDSIFQRTKEHCLMGIKGTVRRTHDGDFIHANVDIDLIIAEEPEWGSREKPVEIFHIIEHFCLGKRRLHVFGRDSTIRPGWVTIGPELTSSNYEPNNYKQNFTTEATYLTGCTEEIERMRPKSPPPKIVKNTNQMQSGQGRGGGRGGFNNQTRNTRPQ